MTTPTFTPARAPSIGGVQKDIQYKIREAEFGDGYSQRAADGINNKRVTFQLQWKALNKTHADAIEAFLDARRGVQAFYYTVPDDVQRKYICKNFNRPQAHGKADSISATFVQVFDV